ncbi:MAG: DUF6867 family protein [Pseudomonadota bacterium]
MEALYATGANGLWVFVLVTLVMGGAASYVTGRAIAQTWRPGWHIAAYAVGLAGAVRFIQYALFAQPFLAPVNLLVDTLVLAAFGLFGYRRMRAFQLPTQYPWLFGHRAAHKPPRG